MEPTAENLSNGLGQPARIACGKGAAGGSETVKLIQEPFKKTGAITCGTKHHRQQDGFIHAGVMTTMADHTAGYCAFTTVPEDFQVLTIEFKINFLKPAYRETLICRSNILRGGKQVIIGESQVFDIHGASEILSAKAMVTMMAVHRDRLSSKG